MSAVKALQKAARQGQRIYHLSAANKASALANIHHDPATLAEINAALAVGKEVITHTEAIEVPGWRGAGYIIMDPLTGEGSYKISGGGNGGAYSLETDLAKYYGVQGMFEENVSDETNYISSYIGFSINLLVNLVDCYAEEILSIAAVIILVIAVALVSAALITGGGAAVALAILVSVGAQEASAAEIDSNECIMDCSFASKWQLEAAGIYDAEFFKEKEWGLRPTSAYDICACKDGSIAIFGVKQCGKINALVEVTDRRWK